MLCSRKIHLWNRSFTILSGFWIAAAHLLCCTAAYESVNDGEDGLLLLSYYVRPSNHVGVLCQYNVVQLNQSTVPNRNESSTLTRTRTRFVLLSFFFSFSFVSRINNDTCMSVCLYFIFEIGWTVC
jgi:hypothetical protein